MTALDESQSLVLLGMSKGKDIETLVTVALFSGLRRGELLALRWCDVDFADETLHVRQALEETRGEKQPGKQYRTTVLQFKEPKTRKSRRAVALDAATIRMLKRQRAQQNAHRLAFGEAYRADLDLVFCAEDGSPFKPDTITKRFASLVKAAPIPHLRFHDLRHSHATQLLRAGVHFKIVSERLGHASVAITLDRYSHVLPGMDRQALEALTRLYASAAS
jgi:integrase